MIVRAASDNLTPPPPSCRQRHIWQRSLFVSSLYQVAFYCADVVSGVPTAVSAPIRLGIGLMQLVFLVLMALKLVHPHQ